MPAKPTEFVGETVANSLLSVGPQMVPRTVEQAMKMKESNAFKAVVCYCGLAEWLP